MSEFKFPTWIVPPSEQPPTPPKGGWKALLRWLVDRLLTVK